MLQIPLTAAHDRYVMTVRLDGRDYRLSFAYNAFLTAWYVSVSTSDNRALKSGLRLVEGGVYALSSADDRAPPGAFVFLGPDAAPQRAFGSESKLVYVAADELDQFGASL